MTASVCSYFINVRTALFFGMKKTLTDIMKKLIHRIIERQLKNPKCQRLHSKIEKSNNGFKVKNYNGPISIFICYCSSPRWIRKILYHVLSDKHMGPILFVSNENKNSIWSVFWINPKSIWHPAKFAAAFFPSSLFALLQSLNRFGILFHW